MTTLKTAALLAVLCLASGARAEDKPNPLDAGRQSRCAAIDKQLADLAKLPPRLTEKRMKELRDSKEHLKCGAPAAPALDAKAKDACAKMGAELSALPKDAKKDSMADRVKRRDLESRRKRAGCP